jgi:type II secretory pathway component PulF
MESPQPTLEYRSPHSAAARPVFSVPAFVASGAVVAVLLLDLLVVVPRFGAIFRDFAAPLPGITELLLSVSRFFAGGAWVVFLVLPVVIGFLAALLAPAQPAVEPSEGRRRRRTISLMYLLMTLAIAAILLVTIVALFMPMIALVNAVSGK